MSRKIAATLAAAAVGAIGLLMSLPATAAQTTVMGKVGPGYTISLTIGGKKVTKLKAGVKYRFVVADRSEDHDFRLRGPRDEQGALRRGVHGHEDDRAVAEEGVVQVLLRAPLGRDARRLQGLLGERSWVAPPRRRHPATAVSSTYSRSFVPSAPYSSMSKEAELCWIDVLGRRHAHGQRLGDLVDLARVPRR